MVPCDYSIFFDFIETYLTSGFQGIQEDDPVIQKLESLMEANDQFLTVMNLDQIRFLYTTKRSKDMLGIEPRIFNPAHILAAIHPDEMDKLAWVNSQLLKTGGEMFQSGKVFALMSFTLRLRNASGNYINILGQNYIFYCVRPEKAVYSIRVFTNVDWFKLKKNSNHQYVGQDLTLFRFPDEQLLKIASVYSSRELEILRLIESGLSSKEISEKLFLSVHTVNTHRSNVLKKSGKANIAELIYELKNQDLL